MRLSTFDEVPVIEYTCSTACISRNHGPGPACIYAVRVVVLYSFETRASISKRVVLSLAGL